MMQIKDPQAPATPAQISFLTDLAKTRDLPAVVERFTLVHGLGSLRKGQASEWIDQLTKAPKLATKLATKPTTTFVVENPPLQQTVNPAAPDAPVLTELPAFGYYEIDGAFYYWDVTGKDSKPVLRKLRVVTNYDGTKTGKWVKVYASTFGPAKAQKVTGTYKPYGGKQSAYKTEITTTVWVPGALAAAVLAGATVLSQAEAAAKGKAVGFCIRCGATLTDPVSVANGIGPVCAKYWA